jgi:hypothetical protein
MLNNESQFLSIHNEIVPQPTPRQPQVSLDVALSQITDDHNETLQQSIPPNPTVTKCNKKNKFKRRLFLHYTHENRLRYLKRDLHKIYHRTF